MEWHRGFCCAIVIESTGKSSEYPFAGRSQATLRLPAILFLGNVELPPETVVYPYEFIEMQTVNDLILPDVNSGQGPAASLG